MATVVVADEIGIPERSEQADKNGDAACEAYPARS